MIDVGLGPFDVMILICWIGRTVTVRAGYGLGGVDAYVRLYEAIAKLNLEETEFRWKRESCQALLWANIKH